MMQKVGVILGAGASAVTRQGPREDPHEYCGKRKLPPLSILVVISDTGVPGEGFTAVRDIPTAQMQVFGHDWLDAGPPKPKDLAVACRTK
jgi:hypothetical protein